MTPLRRHQHLQRLHQPLHPSQRQTLRMTWGTCSQERLPLPPRVQQTLIRLEHLHRLQRTWTLLLRRQRQRRKMMGWVAWTCSLLRQPPHRAPSKVPRGGWILVTSQHLLRRLRSQRAMWIAWLPWTASP